MEIRFVDVHYGDGGGGGLCGTALALPCGGGKDGGGFSRSERHWAYSPEAGYVGDGKARVEHLAVAEFVQEEDSVVLAAAFGEEIEVLAQRPGVAVMGFFITDVVSVFTREDCRAAFGVGWTGFVDPAAAGGYAFYL